MYYKYSTPLITITQQAEGDPAVTAVESGTDGGGLSRLRSTVSAVFDGKGERLRPDRSHMGERIWSVGDRPSDEEHQPKVKPPYSIEKKLVYIDEYRFGV